MNKDYFYHNSQNLHSASSYENIQLPPAYFEGWLWKYHKKIGNFQKYLYKFNHGLMTKTSSNQQPKSIQMENAILHKNFAEHNLKTPYPYYLTLKIGPKIKHYFSANKHDIEQWFNVMKKYCLCELKYQDEFEKDIQLGVGHSCTVWRLKSRTTQKIYAGKVILLKDRFAIDEKILKEIKINRELDHPCIPKFHAAYIEEGQICLIFDLIEGPNLHEFLKLNGSLKEEEALPIMRGILDTLIYLQKKKIVHNDIKFNNILMATNQTRTQIKVIDFGLSGYIDEIKPSSVCCGTVGFIAPEVLEGKKYDYKADVFGAGIVFYALLTGKFPFKLKSKNPDELLKLNRDCMIPFPAEYWNHISKSTLNLVTKMTKKHPSHRCDAFEALSMCSLVKETTQSTLCETKPSCIFTQNTFKFIESKYQQQDGLLMKQDHAKAQNCIEIEDDGIVEDDLLAPKAENIKTKDYIMKLKPKPQQYHKKINEKIIDDAIVFSYINGWENRIQFQKIIKI